MRVWAPPGERQCSALRRRRSNKNHQVVKILNEKGQNCLEVAKTAGHPDIATVLECLEAARVLESKNESFLTITPHQRHHNIIDEPHFAKPFGISSSKKIRTKVLKNLEINTSARSS